MFDQKPILIGRVFIYDETMNVARSAPQGAHYQADVIDLHDPLNGN